MLSKQELLFDRLTNKTLIFIRKQKPGKST